MTRRELLVTSAGVLGGAVLAGCQPQKTSSLGDHSSGHAADGTIDRRAVVTRHNPHVQKIEPFSALTVGNGSFAFTADATGLQTFNDVYQKEFPLCTCAEWAWHTTPRPADVHPEDFKYKEYMSHGRPVGYATSSKGQEHLFNWLRENPHRMHLGRIGLMLKKPDGSEAQPSDITAIDQTLDLWSGTLESRFQFAGQAVRVRTCCHASQDALAVRIDSPLIRDRKLAVQILFPYPSPSVSMADWNSPQKHQTELTVADRRATLNRTADADRYQVNIEWKAGRLEAGEGPHHFILSGTGDSLEFVVLFSPASAEGSLPSVEKTFHSSEERWDRFWSDGGVIDLAASTDPRAHELERRFVLSQYNTALHCAEMMPPPETGMLFNSWYGKSHLEMHWWHGVHFAAWNRLPLFERSLNFYQKIMPVARETAVRQGYDGVRWPKMVGPRGYDSPSPIGPLLIWQQPHPIYYAELCYSRHPNRQTLEQWREIVFESANFMASYAALEGDRYVLGPPLKTVSENTNQLTSKDPTFELTYWRFGLNVAQTWRKRLGMPPDERWADVLNRLAPAPQLDGRYLMNEGMTDTYTKWNWEHPALLGAYGMQRGDGIDPAVMRATLAKVMDVWQWDRCWGWDFPMAAMTAAKLGEIDVAMDALLIESPKNHYHLNGHVYQRPNLTAYLPGNGGLLGAAALIALHGTGETSKRGSTIRRTAKWMVKSEGLSSLL